MRILIITDKEGSAIDRLCNPVVKFNPHLKIKKLAVHPKKYTPEDLNKVRSLIDWADIIDFAYWKTALALLKEIPELKNKKKILGHFNEHSLDEDDWSQFDRIYCCNEWQCNKLQKYNPKLLRLSVDLDLFKFQEYPNIDKKIIGYVGRVGSWKGINEIQKATKELGYEFRIAGNIASAPYWADMDKSNVKFYPDLDDEVMPEFFASLTVYCANSKDGTESGTMPILEAMACGIPVLTRNIGVVREIGEHRNNIYIRQGEYDDIEDLKKSLKELVEDKKLKLKFRDNGRREVRRRSYWKRAREFNRFYHDVLYPDQPLVSIIIPTFNRASTLEKTLGYVRNTNYKNIEVIVTDDCSTDNTKEMVEDFRSKTEIPIKYIKSGSEDVYGLAQARNFAAVEAVGKYLVFLDDRLGIDESAITEFVKALEAKNGDVIFGCREESTKYVENFSAISRENFFKIGMFNHMMINYGGMTEYYMSRISMHGLIAKLLPQARSIQLLKSSSKWTKQDEIAKAKFLIDKINET